MALTWAIAEYMNTAARECSVTPPSSWINATGASEVLMKAFMLDTVREIHRRHDWNQLCLDQTITGTGVSSYALEADFDRLVQSDNAVYENGPNERPVVPIFRNGDWTELIERNWAGVQRFYRLAGSNIEFFQALPTAGEVTVHYVSKNWATAADGVTPQASWGMDDDLSYIPGHLLQFGVVWRFRRHKGLQYADRKAEFESEFARAMSSDRPIGKVATDASREMPRSPFDVPVPDYIPSS